MNKAENFETSLAVCPFCKQITATSGRILKGIAVIDSAELLWELLNNTNRVKCTECGKDFFYEYPCAVINVISGYAVALLPARADKTGMGNTSLFKILGVDHRLRYVQEFIYLCEKARIFQFNLDDRVLEVIKYKYLAEPLCLGTDAKIILTGSDGDAFVFTVYDDYDAPLAEHRVSAAAYNRCMQWVNASPPPSGWVKIDLNWAENFIKEIEQ